MTDTLTDGPVLRRARLSDAELLRAWRNDTRRWMGNTRRIPAAEHGDWLQRILRSSHIVLQIAEMAGTPVGCVRITHWPGWTEIGITVAPNARNRGIGRTLIRMAASRERGRLFAHIRPGNIASERAFAAAGFVRRGQMGDFIRYERAAVRPSDDHQS